MRGRVHGWGVEMHGKPARPSIPAFAGTGFAQDELGGGGRCPERDVGCIKAIGRNAPASG